jgi:glycosyltransferase involved in cell wall biosynthesis
VSTSAAPGQESVALCVEQLRRAAPGGIGTYVRGLVQGLSGMAAGERPEIVLHASRHATRHAGGPGRPGRPGRPGAGEDAVATLGFPVHSSRLPGWALTRVWDAGIYREGRRHSLVHATSLATPPPAGRPLLVTVHDLAWRTVPDAFPARGRRWHEGALRRAAARASGFVVPSAETGGELSQALTDAGMPPPPVTVIPHGSDHLPPPDAEGTASLLAELGVHGPYLLAVGTLEPRKNLKRLFSAYSIARAELAEPWPLIVGGPAGWGGEVSPVEGVILAGAVAAGVLSGLYGGARCVAYVPITEGFGFPALEAMAAGAPVVASRVPSTGGSVLEVDPLDEASIAAGLVAASTDGSERDELAAAGRAHAAALTWRASAEEHVRVWRTAMAAAGHRAA